LRENLKVPTSDITFLAPKHSIGRKFVEMCVNSEIPVHHTFGDNWENTRCLKLNFRSKHPQIKATTLHSFKGLEGRCLVIYVNEIERPEDCSLFYTALTRLLKHPEGSLLTIVSSCTKLSDFVKQNCRNDFDYHESESESSAESIFAALGIKLQ